MRTRNEAAIERPNCPTCGTRLMLARVQPQSKGLDLQTFDCPKCDTTHQIVVRTDPMRSPAANWVNANLKPPE